jgi:TetR/AcrR family transcriptional repressor of nem operon
MTTAEASAREDTRGKILTAAFEEFYRHGFQGGNINHIVERAGITKGALFHYFAGKRELALVVIDEIIGPITHARWMHPLENSSNPLVDLKREIRQHIKEDVSSGAYLQGCPLNNIAQEMSPLDEGFRKRVDRLYSDWRQAIAIALTSGIKGGTVRKDISPHDTAALVVAAQMGIWGSAKNSRSADLMIEAGNALCGYLDTLKPASPRS